MYLLRRMASSYEHPDHNFMRPSFRLNTLTLLTPSNPRRVRTLLIVYRLFLMKLMRSFIFQLFYSKLMFFFQSYQVTIPSLLLSIILNSSRDCCSVMSMETYLQAFQKSLWLRTCDFLPARSQNLLKPFWELKPLSLIHSLRILKAMLNYFPEKVCPKLPDWVILKEWLSLRVLFPLSNILEATVRSKLVMDLLKLLSSIWMLKVVDRYCLVLGSISKNYWVFPPNL